MSIVAEAHWTPAPSAGPSKGVKSMPRKERKFWPPLSRHIHILGEVRQIMHGQGVISALCLYEESVCRGNEPTDVPPVRIEALIGACNGIRCTICGEPVYWAEPPTDAYERLLGHYPRKDV